jgi:uncharacterized protein YkwD
MCLGETCCTAERVCGSQCCPDDSQCVDNGCCPLERICGDTCCLGELCINEECCPIGRACGDTCCPQGQQCIGDQCWQDSEEAAIVSLINAFRASHNVAPALILQVKLGRAAELHAQDQAAHDFSSRTGSNGSQPDERIAAAGYSAQTWGENVASHSSDGSAQMALSLWQNSSQERAAMLNATFEEIGVGRAQSTSGAWYWTADFARPG